MSEINVKVKFEGLEVLTESIVLLATAIGNLNPGYHPARLGPKDGDKEIKQKAKEGLERIAADYKNEPKEVLYTEQQIRKLMVSKNSVENRPKLKAILSEHGANNISELQEEHYEDVVKELSKLDDKAGA